ncbi:MAG: flippase-like domain-containing protein [Methanocorpusculum parvum]|nr:flippase-like domain-containing protein [Methanocorpusculum parvum]
MDKTQKRLLLISLGISFTVLFLFLAFTIDRQTLQALQSANLWLILLALFMHIVSIGFWALRIQLMSKSLGYHVPFLHSFNLVCSNQFLASVTPSQVGGEPVRIYELVKAKVPVADATAVVIMERVFDAVVLLIGAMVSLVLLNITTFGIEIPDYMMTLSYFSSAVFFAVLVIFVVFARKPVLGKAVVSRAAHFFLRKKDSEKREAVSAKLLNSVNQFYESLGYFMGKSRYGTFIGLFFTALLWVNEFVLVSVLLMALGLEPYFALSFLFMILITVILMVPITPGGAGVAEVSMAGFFSLIVPANLLGVFVLLWRLIIYYFNLASGFISTLIILRREAKDREVKV